MEMIQQVEINMPVPVEVSEVRSNTGTRRVEEDSLQIFMNNKLSDVSGEPFKARVATIFRLPAWFYEINKDLAEPKIISIGPYHYGKQSVRAMEENKWSTLRDFLARKANVRFEVYLQEMRLLEAQARECYSETVCLASDDFVMMLLLDACFILEFLYKQKSKDQLAISYLNWATEFLCSDLCLLENQIPFFIIHKLFEIQNGQNCAQGNCPLLNLIYEKMPWPVKEFVFSIPKISCSEIQHLLHLFYSGVIYESYLQGDIIIDSSRTISIELSSRNELVPCATELHEAGVRFRRNKSPRNVFDIKFENGTMEIPNIQIDNVLKNYLWNMVVFEQSQPFKFAPILISYVALLDMLINTEKDVAILERANIISNFLKNGEQAATFFNQFSESSFFGFNVDSGHLFYLLLKYVKRYIETPYSKWRAQLMRSELMRYYFNSPWSFISVMAATILLILTVLQTYYSAK